MAGVEQYARLLEEYDATQRAVESLSNRAEGPAPDTVTNEYRRKLNQVRHDFEDCRWELELTLEDLEVEAEAYARRAAALQGALETDAAARREFAAAHKRRQGALDEAAHLRTVLAARSAAELARTGVRFESRSSARTIVPAVVAAVAGVVFVASFLLPWSGDASLPGVRKGPGGGTPIGAIAGGVLYGLGVIGISLGLLRSGKLRGTLTYALTSGAVALTSVAPPRGAAPDLSALGPGAWVALGAVGVVLATAFWGIGRRRGYLLACGGWTAALALGVVGAATHGFGLRPARFDLTVTAVPAVVAGDHVVKVGVRLRNTGWEAGRLVVDGNGETSLRLEKKAGSESWTGVAGRLRLVRMVSEGGKEIAARTADRSWQVPAGAQMEFTAQLRQGREGTTGAGNESGQYRVLCLSEGGTPRERRFAVPEREDPAYRLFTKAKTAEEAGKVDSAIVLYEEVKKDYPKSEWSAKTEDRLVLQRNRIVLNQTLLDARTRERGGDIGGAIAALNAGLEKLSTRYVPEAKEMKAEITRIEKSLNDWVADQLDSAQALVEDGQHAKALRICKDAEKYVTPQSKEARRIKDILARVRKAREAKDLNRVLAQAEALFGKRELDDAWELADRVTQKEGDSDLGKRANELKGRILLALRAKLTAVAKARGILQARLEAKEAAAKAEPKAFKAELNTLAQGWAREYAKLGACAKGRLAKPFLAANRKRVDPAWAKALDKDIAAWAEREEYAWDKGLYACALHQYRRKPREFKAAWVLLTTKYADTLGAKKAHEWWPEGKMEKEVSPMEVKKGRPREW